MYKDQNDKQIKKALEITQIQALKELEENLLKTGVDECQKKIDATLSKLLSDCRKKMPDPSP